MKLSKRRNKIAVKKQTITELNNLLTLEPLTRSMGAEAFGNAFERNMIRLKHINQTEK